MKIKTRINAKSAIGIWITLSLFALSNFLLLLINYTESSLWISLFAIITIIALIENSIVLIYSGYSIFSIALAFIALSYLFSFGQVYINAWLPNHKFITSNFLWPMNDIMRKALVFSYNVIQLVVIGMMLTREEKNVLVDSIKSKDAHINIRKLAIIICIITVPMRLYYIYRLIVQTRLNTYKLAVVENFSGVFIQLSYFCLIGYILLMLSFDRNIIKARMVLVLSVLLLGAEMLSGGRVYAVVSIISIVYCYINCIEKPKKKTLIAVLIAGFFALKLLTVITTLRTSSVITISAIGKGLLSTDHSFIVNALDEFGSTFFTIRETLTEVPSNLPYHYGQSYIKAWSLVLLNINGMLEPLQQSIEYPVKFALKYAYGGSYIGELYYNFGYIGLLFAPLIGILVGKISNKTYCYLVLRRYYSLAYWIMPMFASLMWVRGYFNVFTRGIVWGIVFIFIISRLCLKNNYGALHVQNQYNHSSL